MATIRKMKAKGEELWVAADVCAAIGLKNTTTSLRKVNQDYRFKVKCPTNGGDQELVCINRNGLLELVLKTRKPRALDLVKELGLDVAINPCDEAFCMRTIINAFSDLHSVHQYYVDPYMIDLYFVSERIAIECDEDGHSDRNKVKEWEREHYIRSKLGCNFVRFNPQESGFDIGRTIYEIRNLLNTTTTT